MGLALEEDRSREEEKSRELQRRFPPQLVAKGRTSALLGVAGEERAERLGMHWYVVVGGPGTGKTASLHWMLGDLGAALYVAACHGDFSDSASASRLATGPQEAGEPSKQDTTSRIREAFAAPSNLRQVCLRRVASEVPISHFIDAAIAEYRRFGNEDRLTLSASALIDLGPAALPALRALAEGTSPESAPFVSAAASLAGVPLSQRLDLLRIFARHPLASVRERVAGILETSQGATARSLLGQLATDVDEDVAELAREQLNPE